MNNIIYKSLLEYISEDREDFETLLSADNTLGLNVTSDEIISFLEFSTNNQKNVIMGNIIITEGDILSVLKLVSDLKDYEGEFILYINEDNVGTITYIIKRINEIYESINLNINIKIDYSKNYNNYLNSIVTIYGSKDFIETTKVDFPSANKVIV